MLTKWRKCGPGYSLVLCRCFVVCFVDRCSYFVDVLVGVSLLFCEWSSLLCSLTSVIVFFVSLVCHGLLFLICELFVVMSVDFLFASVFVPLFVGPLNVC